jgi:hypothetical protein
MNNTFGMTRDEIFEAIRAGTVTLTQFDDWLDDIINDFKNIAYDAGHFDGKVYGIDDGNNA